MRENLAVIAIDKNPESGFNNFRNHARNMVELFASSRWETTEIYKRIEFEGLDVFDSALSAGKGVILISVHVGNWEVAALYLASRGFDLSVVAGIQMNRLFTGSVKAAKEKWGIGVINPENSYRGLFKALEANGIVALMLDGDVFKSGARIKMFGKETVLPTGVYELSKRTGAPVIGGYCRRISDGRFHVHAEEIIGGGEVRTIPEDIALSRIYGRIEDFIGLNRDQWCIFRRFWS